MKKLLLGLALVFALTGCNKSQEVSGTFSHESYGTTYSITVKVTVSGDKIEAIEVTEDKNVTASDVWASASLWTDGKAAYIESFVGKTVEEVNGYEVKTLTEWVVDEDADGISGATMSSARALAAIQNALSKLA